MRKWLLKLLMRRTVPQLEGNSRLSEHCWDGNEARLPINPNDCPRYQCVVLYLGCSEVTGSPQHTSVLDTVIRHLHRQQSVARTVLIQVYHHYTLVRDSSSKVRLVFPNECIAVCMSTPIMPACLGLFMTNCKGGRDCFLFGVDVQLMQHGSSQHKRYAERFNLTCPNVQDGEFCPAFPGSPARLLFHLQSARSLYSSTQSVGFRCSRYSSTSSLLSATSTFCSSSSKASDISEMLKNDGIRDLFRAFLEKQFCVENLDFHSAVSEFRRIPLTNNNLLISAARRIYETHVKPNCPQLINVDSVITKEVQKAVDEGRFTRDMFDAAQNQIFRLLKYDCWPRFIASTEGAPLPVDRWDSIAL
ncbi:hypothetical protein L596_015274 [Steinernema carpocapsae]|uniref:RGS domain-containing protein n=1 Tax=Steinernema carpocapsae TaxID=34508 RepID=A0A4U5NFD7_STECR|nr:hypothetical protein L596_015274 [Steinernema carpocapsae]